LYQREQAGFIVYTYELCCSTGRSHCHALVPRWITPAPWRLTVVLVLQYIEHLTDEQAAGAVRTRIDWKYALGLTLDDPGFDASVLSQFRVRLLESNASILLLQVLSDYCKHRGWLNTDGK